MARQLSTDLDIESLRYPSWCLSRLLDKLIGSKEVVSLRRKLRSMHYYLVNVKTSYTQLHSGSRGEGFELQSSDLDLMIIDRNAVVMESIHSTRSLDDSKTVLLMRRERCNPGFIILQLLDRTSDSAIGLSVVEYLGHPVVSSLLFRDVNRNPERGEVGHGPCNTIKGICGADLDIAHCFECNQWPTEANEFIYRRRLHGWPEKSLIDKIICKGCHLVPIGDKDSDLSYIQWRLPFSAAEKDLVHSFNHTQFLVYGLLKIFLKQFINKFHLADGILCSYFLKTAIFYSIESTPSYLWREDLLIPCFWLCVNKLISWIEQGYCPNYFVPQNNMFRNKVVGQYRHYLLSVLNQCKRIGWTCIYLCEDLQVLQNVLSHSESLNSSGLIPSEKEREMELDEVVAKFSAPTIRIREFNSKQLSRSLTLLNHSRTQQEEDLSTLMLYDVLKDIPHSGFCIDASTSNKSKYKTMRKCKVSLSTASSGLGYIGSLYMATFYHNTGQIQQAIPILERAISTWKPYALYQSLSHMEIYFEDLYLRYVCGRGRSLKDKYRYACVKDIFISQGDKAAHPPELCCDIEALFLLCVPPLPYIVFLLFLFHHRVGNIDRSLSVLHDLKVLSCDSAQGGRQYPVVYNMLAICLDKLGNRHDAVEMCLLSQKLKPDEHGAERLLDKILSGLC